MVFFCFKLDKSIILLLNRYIPVLWNHTTKGGITNADYCYNYIDTTSNCHWIISFCFCSSNIICYFFNLRRDTISNS